MHQVAVFLWICGLYIGLSVAMAYLVAAYDPRRPKVISENPAPVVSREERAVVDPTQWCLGLRDLAHKGPYPVVVGPERAPWLRNALQHATGYRMAATREAKYFGRYSRAVFVIREPAPADINSWNSLFMGWTLNFKGPRIGVLESKLAADPQGQLKRVLLFLGQNTTGIECALQRLPPPEAASNSSNLLQGEAKEKWDMVLTALNDSGVQLQ